LFEQTNDQLTIGSCSSSISSSCFCCCRHGHRPHYCFCCSC